MILVASLLCHVPIFKVSRAVPTVARMTLSECPFPLWFNSHFDFFVDFNARKAIISTTFILLCVFWLSGFRVKNEVKVQQTRKMSVSLTVMTFNLLEDQPEDSPNSWDKRKDLCVTVITSYSPMILCTQQGVWLWVKCVCVWWDCMLLWLNLVCWWL